jgi:hypothetical protein
MLSGEIELHFSNKKGNTIAFGSLVSHFFNESVDSISQESASLSDSTFNDTRLLFTHLHALLLCISISDLNPFFAQSLQKKKE